MTLNKTEQRLRECYDEFLAAVQDERDLWAIALLDYYRLPIEWWRAEPDEEQSWQQPVPACFADLWTSGEIARLVQRKDEICPDADCCSVPRNLELEYDWHQAWVYPDCPRYTMPFAAVKLLLEYYRLVDENGDDRGDAVWRYLFDETSDEDMLVTIAKRSAKTPLQELELLLDLYEIWREVEMKPSHHDRLFHALWDWLGWILHADDGEACWVLYQYLQENDGHLAIWDDDLTNLELLQKAAEAGIHEAQLELGWRYADDCRDGVLQEHWTPLMPAEEAVHWLEEALPYDSAAGFILAQIYCWGYGVQPSEERVAHYCRLTADTRYEGQAAAHQELCITWLADRYTAGVGVPLDRAEAARLYRRTERGEGVYPVTKRPERFLFRYCADGVDQPRDPRAAIHWWLRAERSPAVRFTRYGLRDEATADRPEDLRWLKLPVESDADPEERYRQANARKRLYDYLEGVPVPTPPEADEQLQLRERVRLLYDAQQAGDERCGQILAKLCAREPQLTEWLAELTPNADGIWDWPDDRYEQLLEELEQELARQKERYRLEEEHLQLLREEKRRWDALTPEQQAEEISRCTQPQAGEESTLEWLLSLSSEQLQRAFDEAVSPQPGEWWNSLTPAQQQSVFNAMDLDADLPELDEYDHAEFEQLDYEEWLSDFWEDDETP